MGSRRCFKVGGRLVTSTGPVSLPQAQYERPLRPFPVLYAIVLEPDLLQEKRGLKDTKGSGLGFCAVLSDNGPERLECAKA